MVATPIGNMADITLRALHVLGLVDAVACEDSRHTSQLMQTYGLHKPLMAVHMHNEREGATKVLERLSKGERVAYVSDAGTPGVSDPGAILVATVSAAGYRVVPLPGASSITTLISAWGQVSEHHEWASQGFRFVGFLPAKGGERVEALKQLFKSPQSVIWLEAPHRLEKLAQEISVWGDRIVSIGRELTKRFEHVHTLKCFELPAWLSADTQNQRGEFVFALHPAPQKPTDDAVPVEVTNTLSTLLQHVPLKTAVQLTVALTGVPKKLVYSTALTLSADSGSKETDH